MSFIDLAPWGAIIVALGLTLLLNSGRATARIAGVVFVFAGALPLVLTRAPDLLNRITLSPVVVGLVLVGILAVAALTVLFVAAPWLAVVAGLVAGLRIPLDPFSPSPTNHLIPLWLIVIAGLLALLWRSRRDGWPEPRLGAVGWALAAWIVFAASSLWWSRGVEQGSYTFVAFYASFGSLAAITASLDVRKRLPAAITGALVTVAIIAALVAIFQVVGGHLFWNLELIDGNARIGYVRANSLFWDASALGRIEGLAIIVVIGVLALARRRWSVPLAAAICAVAFAGMALSYSRTSLAMVVFGILLVAFAWRPRLAAALTVLGVVGLVAAALLAGAEGAEFTRLISNRDTIAVEGFREFTAAPIAGVGLGGYPDSHAIVLGIAAELGVIGLLLFFLLAAAVLRAALRPADPAEDRPYRLVALITLAALFANSMLDSGLFDDAASWMLIAIIGALAAPRSPESSPGR